MTALAADRDTPERASPTSQLFAEVGTDSTQYYKGGIVCISTATGKVVKGSTATTLIAIGRCEENYLTGTSNTRKIKARTGCFKFNNSSSSDAIAATEIGAACYIVDDNTVAKTDGTASRSRAGIVAGVDSDGVWVQFTLPIAIS